MKDYQAALDYLYSQLPMFQRIGKQAFKKDLTNIRLFLEELGHPELNFPAVHIAGTNGKGSVTHIIAGGLMAHGLKVGIYTSPHYKDFRERIKIGGQFIEKDFIVDFLNRHEAFIQQLKPSFFEMGVALAFQYFAEKQVDVAVVETGLGGLLDSTNILDPEVAVITNISLDHEDMLGSTIPAIATQKAGIIKPGRTAVIGEYQEDTWPVFEAEAQLKKAPLVLAETRVQVEMLEQDFFGSRFLLKTPMFEQELYADMKGPFLKKNLQTALAALAVLAEQVAWYNFEPAALSAFFPEIAVKTYYIGRWHLLERAPLTVGDSGHNLAGLAGTLEALQKISFAHLHLVLGFTAEKDIQKMLAILPSSAFYYFCKADVPKGLDAQALQSRAAAFGLVGRAYPSVQEALTAARQAADPNDLIFVGGSIFVLAEVL